MTRKTEGVRIGPISLVTLISILLLAVLAMLCVTSANAAQTMAERQAKSTTETYALDSCGQNIVAVIDGKVSKGSDLKSISKQFSSIAKKELKAAGIIGATISTSENDEGALTSFGLSAESGRSLQAKVSVNKKGKLSIDSWKMTTSQQPSEESLWQTSDN